MTILNINGTIFTATLSFIFAATTVKLPAQDAQWEAFTIGSYDHAIQDVINVNGLWRISDMDDGTQITLRDDPMGLSISSNMGIIFVMSINLDEDDSSKRMIISANLPIVFGPFPHVQVYCDKGHFIYLEKLKK